MKNISSHALLLGLQFNLNEFSKIITAIQINGLDHYTFGTEKTNRELVQEYIGLTMMDYGMLTASGVVDQQQLITHFDQMEAESKRAVSIAKPNNFLKVVKNEHSS